MAPVRGRVEVMPIRQRSNGGIVSTTTTTRSRVLRGAGLVIAPLMLLDPPCCGDDSASGSKEAFCDGMKDISTQADELDANSDSASADELMTQFVKLVDRMQELDPPAEIEDDWDSSVGTLDDMSSGSVEDLQTFESTDEQLAAIDPASRARAE